jgi:hypothetical protein
MQPNQHANLLSIFAWIMAGFQLLLVLLYGVYVLMMGGLSVAMALDPKVNDPGGPIVMGVFALIVGIIAIFGIIGSVSNFLLGKRLRSGTPPTQRFVITACIINFLSLFTGGMFATALGVYGLWFALSDQGKAFFAGQGQSMLPGQGYTPYDPNYARDPNRVNWR